MSKKFMRIKRMTIPVISLVIMMSSIVGCSVVSDKELMEMINAGESITIEYAVPDYQSADLEEVPDFEWVELDQLQTYNRGFRQTVDSILNINIITEAGRNGKNGVLFVDATGKRNGNAVLADAFNNKVFVEKYWSDADAVAIFGFGIRGDEAYQYLSVDGERLEVKVTPKLGPVKSVESYDNGFIIFACELRDEEYGDFYEVAEVQGCLDKWAPLLRGIKEVRVVNE